MEDLRKQLEQLREEAEDCDVLSERTLDPEHREMLGRLSAKLHQMIDAIEAAISELSPGEELPLGKAGPRVWIPGTQPRPRRGSVS